MQDGVIENITTEDTGITKAENVVESIDKETAEGEEGLSKETRDYLIGLCERRAHTYDLLGRLFGKEVDEEFYETLRTSSFPARTGNDLVDKGYRFIAKYLSNNHNDPILDLARDFVRTFLGHGNTAYSCAYPYESVYTSEKRLLSQEARDEVLHLYWANGFSVASSWKDPEDHITLEMEFMKTLTERAGLALRGACDEEALEQFRRMRDFMCEHLGAWSPMMLADMRRFAQTDFYQGLSFLTEGFLYEDREFLLHIIEDDKPESLDSDEE